MNNQDQILKYLRTVQCATSEEIYHNQSVRYYVNWDKYISMRMTRLVKSGKVVRIKKGLFAISAKEGNFENRELEMFN